LTRGSQISRTTNETDVTVRIDLDGTGTSAIDTGVGFYDHLLASLAHHALIDMEISTTGDLHVDDHHTVEDTALGLGTAIAEALGDRSGIVRFGEAAVPMDEALARAAVDVGGRAFSVVDLPFRSERIGTLSTQNVAHAVASLAQAGGCTIHLSGSGSNDHHLAEAAFKALARALRAAVAVDTRRGGVPSTKGTA
jgi:imidazoleglycerol-phosphate dehydratase